MAREYKQYTANIDIIVKLALVKAHYSIGIIEHYHRSLYQVHFIIITKLPGI